MTCKNCGTPQETEDDFTPEGLCEDCADRQLLARIQYENDKLEFQAEYDGRWPEPSELPHY